MAHNVPSWTEGGIPPQPKGDGELAAEACEKIELASTTTVEKYTAIGIIRGLLAIANAIDHLPH